MKHNKKRNTAFLYHILLNEASEALYRAKDTDKYTQILNIFKEHFKPKSLLHKELEIYQALEESQDMPVKKASMIVEEALNDHKTFDKQKLFQEQSDLIRKINRTVGQDCYKRHIKNYRNLANIYHLLNSSDSMSYNDRVVLKETVVRTVAAKDATETYIQPIDSIEYNVLVKKFNQKYGKELNERQKTFMRNFLTCYDGDPSFTVYLNDEVKYLKEQIQKSKLLPEIKDDTEMLEKADKIYAKLEEFNQKSYDNDMLKMVLKVQKLIEEINVQEDKQDEQ